LFSIAMARGWDAGTNTYAPEPRRSADCYVFCLHTPGRPRPEDVLDTRTWEFYPWSTAGIDAALGAQKTVKLSRLRSFVRPVAFLELRAAVDREIRTRG
jgi:hypothetical protein